MIIHEYQAKLLLSKNGILIPKGILIKNLMEVEKSIKNLNKENLIIKSQIHSYKRYILGLIKFTKKKLIFFFFIKNILNRNYKKFNNEKIRNNIFSLLIEEKVNFEKKFYFSISINTSKKFLLLILSKEGGIQVERNIKKKEKFSYRVELGVKL